MVSAKTVATGYIKVPFTIHEYEIDGEVVYDWYDSDVLYDTIDEAIRAKVDSVDGSEFMLE